VQIIKLLWTQPPPVTFQGRFYRLEEAPFSPPNVQQPHPPILIGGDGERRTLRIAAKYADAMNVRGSPQIVRRKIQVLHQHCQDVGRDPREIKITVQAMLYLTDDPSFRQRMVRWWAGFLGTEEDEARRTILVGTVDQVKEAVASFAEVGVEEMHFFQFPLRFHRETLLTFSREVIPAFRS